MARDLVLYRAPESAELHPLVHRSMVGLTLWLVLAAWAFFTDSGYTALLLAVVTGFLIIFVALPTALWHTWRKHAVDGASHHPRFREWARGECTTWQSRLSGAEATVQALLPIAALAVGMTAIGIVFAVVAATA